MYGGNVRIFRIVKYRTKLQKFSGTIICSNVTILELYEYLKYVNGVVHTKNFSKVRTIKYIIILVEAYY